MTSVYTDAALLLEWLERDIFENGGTGRRISKVRLELAWSNPRLVAAIDNLVERDLVVVDRESGAAFGFVYLCPVTR